MEQYWRAMKKKKGPAKKAPKKLKALKKKVTKHLKGDIKGYKHEAKEDRELIKYMRKK
jgi:hypothetical protein